MTSRERMLRALNNEKPDRLPCQVHGWMQYYLDTFLNGMDWYQAYEKFDMDYAIYVSPVYEFAEKDLAAWQVHKENLGTDADGNTRWMERIVTPKGELRQIMASNKFTAWHIEYPWKTERDFELWAEFCPVPVKADSTSIKEAKNRLGDRGIIRSHPYYSGQGGPWQALCYMYGTEKAIFMAMDEPDRLHAILQTILQKSLQTTRLWEGVTSKMIDMVETGGGSASSTVISPALFEEFCLPYDQKQNALFHQLGIKTVSHLCGGVMPMLDLVAESGADGLETMTPKAMGGDCDLTEASRCIGDKLFFIGGFDQTAGFERGTPEKIRKQVFDCFEATKDYGGYIISPSDHFFFGDPSNIQAFSDACKECIY